MSTGLLRPDEVVFYHPLDDLDESTQPQTWFSPTGSVGFSGGKLPSGSPTGLSAVTGNAFSFGADSSVSTRNFHAALARIDDTHALAYYPSSSSQVAVRVVTVSGTDVTLGAQCVLGNGTTFSAYPIARLSSSKFVLTTRYGSNGSSYSRVVTVSGTTCTVGATVTHKAHVVGGSNYSGGSIVGLDSTRVLVAWGMGTTTPDLKVQARIGTVTGSDITYGAEATLDTTSVNGAAALNVAMLTSTKVVAVWERDPGSGLELASMVMTVSGNDITGGTVKQAESANPHSFGICALDSTRFAVSFRPNYTVRIGQISGTDITYGATATLSGGSLINVPRCFKLDTDKLIVVGRLGNNAAASVETFSVSGTTLTSLGSSTFDPTPGAQSHVLAGVLNPSKIVCGTYNNANNAYVIAGELGLGASLEAVTPGAYPSVIGDTRVVVAFWAVNATKESTSLDIERGYKVTLTATTISLGGTTAVWSGAAIGTLMSTIMNDGGDHFLVLDFENEGGTTWRLRTAVDGLDFDDQGTQTSGTQAVTTADTAPGIVVSDAFDGVQWFDEMTMWAGDKATFSMFTGEELANLYDLANTFDEGMGQYEENYGAPICWQATAKLPDGSAWHDSGSGPCPPVVRTPRGALDIVVTDDGKVVHPRIQEG